MTTVSKNWTEETVRLAGAGVHLVKGGSGEPLLIFPDELGHPGWLRYHEALAENNTLYIPSASGFSETDGLDWVMGIRDMAIWYLQVMDELGLDHVNAIGFSIGGWLAAEMATMCPHIFKKLVLVGPAGILPPTGEIFDMFLVVAKEFIRQGYLNPDSTLEFDQICPDEPAPEQAEGWEVAREQACRLSWRPYMHNRGLPHLLGRLKDLPTLIMWGKEDAIVPLSAGEVYHRSIRGSRLSVIDNCGHHPEVEKTDEFVRLVKEFLA